MWHVVIAALFVARIHAAVVDIPTPDNKACATSYTFQQGDTCDTLAQKGANGQVSLLYKWNANFDCTKLVPGQTYCVSGPTGPANPTGASGTGRGNCKPASQLVWDASRIYTTRWSAVAPPQPQLPYERSIDNTDWVVWAGGEYSLTDGGAGLTLPITRSATKNAQAGIASTMLILYGKISVDMRLNQQGAGLGGLINTFFLAADGGDEIDVEVFNRKNGVETNMWTTGHTITAGAHVIRDLAPTADGFTRYTMDWKKDSVVWTVGGQVVLTMTTGIPTTPQAIYFGVWDGSGSVKSWSGDWDVPVGTQDSVQFKNLAIECY